MRKVQTISRKLIDKSANRLGSSETIRRAPLKKRVIIAYLQGALHDATLNKSKRFRFSQKGKKWLEVLQKYLKFLGYNSWIYREGKTRDVYVLETLAKVLDFKFDPLILKSISEKKSYIKGFFDAEGGIPHSARQRFYVQLAQNNKLKLLKIKRILNDIRVFTGEIHNPSKILHPEYWRMFVSVNSQKRFVDLIGTSHPRKLNILKKRMII